MNKSNKGGIILNIASDLSVISPDQRIYKDSNLPEMNNQLSQLLIR